MSLVRHMSPCLPAKVSSVKSKAVFVGRKLKSRGTSQRFRFRHQTTGSATSYYVTSGFACVCRNLNIYKKCHKVVIDLSSELNLDLKENICGVSVALNSKFEFSVFPKML